MTERLPHHSMKAKDVDTNDVKPKEDVMCDALHDVENMTPAENTPVSKRSNGIRAQSVERNANVVLSVISNNVSY